MKGKNKRPGSFAESGPLEFRVRQACQSDTAASRIAAILGLAMLQRLPHRQAAGTQRKDAHERTEADEGLGVAGGVPAVHDGCPGSIPFEARASARCFVQMIVALSSDRTQCK